MLTKLAVKNFKSIEDTGVLELKPLTIFTGPNSSGKSNILESIAILGQTFWLSQEVSHTLADSLRSGEFFTYPYPPYLFIAHKKDLNRWISFEIHARINDQVKSMIREIGGPPISESVGYTYSFKPEGEEATQYISLDKHKLIEIAKIRTAPNSSILKVTYPKEFENLGVRGSAENILRSECFDFTIPKQTESRIVDTVERVSFVAKEVIKILTNCLRNSYFISAARGLLETETKIKRIERMEIRIKERPLWVGKQGEHLIEILALCFGKREYESKAERIIEWAEKFGIGKIKAGWWG
jgi:hypothetical protein